MQDEAEFDPVVVIVNPSPMFGATGKGALGMITPSEPDALIVRSCPILTPDVAWIVPPTKVPAAKFRPVLICPDVQPIRASQL